MKKDNQENQSRFAQAQLTDNFSFFVDSKKLSKEKEGFPNGNDVDFGTSME